MSANTVRIKQLNIMVRTAMMQMDEKGIGSLSNLAAAAKVPYTTLVSSLDRGVFSASVAKKMEENLGRDLIKREELCPEIFG